MELTLGLSSGWKAKECEETASGGWKCSVMLETAEEGTCVIYGGEFGEIVT